MSQFSTMGLRCHCDTPALPAAAPLATDSANSSRFHDLRLLLAAGLFGSAAIHAAVVPEHLTEWAAAGVFFIVLTAAELVGAALLLTRLQPNVLLGAAVVSIGLAGTGLAWFDDFGSSGDQMVMISAH